MSTRHRHKNKKGNKNRHTEFSKLIIIQEAALVWISTLKLLNFAEVSINSGFTGSLPYIATLVGAIWTAYGVSVAFYYNKAKAENINKNNVQYNIPTEEMSKLKQMEDTYHG